MLSQLAASLLPASLVPRSNGGPTNLEFRSEWQNPTDVLSVVSIVGADIVRVALANLAGSSTLVPFPFSFGCVGFGVLNFLSLSGDGKLMPPIDHPCMVFNVESGYARECRSWMLGRLLRDSEERLTDESLCITVWNATGGKDNNPMAGHPVKSRGWVWWMSLSVILAQLAIAAVPWIKDDDYGIFLITAVGTGLALLTASLPQWRAEKYACRQNDSKKKFLITSGNGSRHVMLINGNGACLDFEDLARSEGPRSYRTWTNYRKIKSSVSPQSPQDKRGPNAGHSISSSLDSSFSVGSMPLGYHYTRVMAVLLAVLWILFLICISALKINAWYLLLIGSMGLLQNAITAGSKQHLGSVGLHMEKAKTIKSHSKVMYALMDLERESPNAGLSLLSEFFPGEISPSEEAWWDRARMKIRQDSYKRAVAKGRKDIKAPDWDAMYRKWGGSVETWIEATSEYDRRRAEAESSSQRTAKLARTPTELEKVVVDTAKATSVS